MLSGYDNQWLGAVLPGAAAALGHRLPDLPAVPLPAARRVCVVLVDGLGSRQLAESSRAAPFLAAAPTLELTAGCPTTTATSMASFGTGQSPGRHGIAGYSVLNPATDTVVNQLRWDFDEPPRQWQALPTVFELLADPALAGLDRTALRSAAIGNPEFAGSGLTEAAHRGTEFFGHKRLAPRVDLAVSLLKDPDGPRLVYLYWGAVDAAGHRHGWRSSDWRRALQRTDAELHRLARSLPAGCLLLVTADHGMVDAAAHDRVDLADRPELRSGVRHVGGEPRLLQVYTEPGAAGAVADRLADLAHERAWVRTREQAIAEGWFGQVSASVQPRIGDVLVAGRGEFTLVDSDTMTPDELGLVGYHGSLTEGEQYVPLVVLPT
ncbi:alkaline phosphatase family protein [Nakamurella sp. DB0629]|uniref:Alkaline phosphatase family protein n=1 Tax=Nakamurella aerolata TaxID=1656892 RepID=A0A849A5E2_9ACTN|nr:alkaline phosphatase family protein [Nakamurella aerolata]